MAIITVTATITFDYDTEDGLVTNEEEAIDDVAQHLDSYARSGDFEYIVKEN